MIPTDDYIILKCVSITDMNIINKRLYICVFVCPSESAERTIRSYNGGTHPDRSTVIPDEKLRTYCGKNSPPAPHTPHPACLTLGHQVQTIPQFLNYFNFLSISSYVW